MRALGLLLLAACSRSPSPVEPAHSGVATTPLAATASAPAPGVSARSLAREAVTFVGMCDASGAVELTERLFAVADDEDNVIRTYDAERGGAPLATVDLSPSLHLPQKASKASKPGAKPKRAPETDLEAATRIGDRGYWMTSHGRSSSGKLKPERLRFFATTVPANGAELALVGEPYEHLLDDLLAEPRLSSFDLRGAAELAPKSPGGFNLEGMTAREEGGVWLGFRNPVPAGRALLVPLLNPEELVRGGRAAFGDPVTLDLDGLGVRALSSFRKRYVIAAGSSGDGGTSRLFTWDGRASVRPVSGLELAGFNPEGFFTPDRGERILVLSDDGTELIDGVACKALDEPGRKRFRGAWIAMDKAP